MGEIHISIYADIYDLEINLNFSWRPLLWPC